MKDLQEVFTGLQEKKQEKKKLQSVYKDALSNNQPYSDLVDKLKEMREKKKTMEYQIQAELGADYDRLEDLKLEIKAEQEMLSDIALTQYMQGEEVTITDEHDQEYEPVLKVSFKKVK